MKQTDHPRRQDPIRSPKVSRIMGEMPVGLVRAGWLVIVVVAAALLLAAFLVPWPENPAQSVAGHLLENI